VKFSVSSRLLVLSVLLVGMLAAGCTLGPRRNQRVYDRYLELVAERSRAPVASEPVVEPAKPETAAPRRVPETRPAPQPQAQQKPAARSAPAPAKKPAQAPVAKKPAPAPAQKPVQPPVAKPAAKPEAAAPPVAVIPPPQKKSATPAPAETPSEEPAEGMGYVLKPSDVVQIYLRGIPNAEAVEQIIDEYGLVNLPFINEVQAAGWTSSELARHIRQTYIDQGIYQNLSVSVVVPARYYFIQGEIRAPGRYQLVVATRLSQAIAGAGAYTEFASGKVVVKRGGEVFRTIKNAKRLDRRPADDILIEPDDIIEVHRSFW
jgi:protein involved in polysaccharide export with SLBB domain